MLIDMVILIRRGQNLGFINVIHSDSFQNLRLREMSDPALGHDGDGDRIHDRLHQLRRQTVQPVPVLS